MLEIGGKLGPMQAQAEPVTAVPGSIPRTIKLADLQLFDVHIKVGVHFLNVVQLFERVNELENRLRVTPFNARVSCALSNSIRPGLFAG